MLCNTLRVGYFSFLPQSDAVEKSFTDARGNAQVFEILAGVSIRVEAAKNSLQSEIDACTAAARKEEREAAAETAAKAHEAHLARETKLADFIRALRRDLKVKEFAFRVALNCLELFIIFTGREGRVQEVVHSERAHIPDAQVPE